MDDPRFAVSEVKHLLPTKSHFFVRLTQPVTNLSLEPPYARENANIFEKHVSKEELEVQEFGKPFPTGKPILLFFSNKLICNDLHIEQGGFAVLWQKQEGQLPRVDPPGFQAASDYPGNPQVHHGHLIPRSYGGNGDFENIVTVEAKFNQTRMRDSFEREIERTLSYDCFVCAFAIPVYQPASTKNKAVPFGSTRPVPKAFVYAVFSDTKSYGAHDAAPQLFGDLANEKGVWRHNSAGLQSLNY